MQLFPAIVDFYLFYDMHIDIHNEFFWLEVSVVSFWLPWWPFELKTYGLALVWNVDFAKKK